MAWVGLLHFLVAEISDGLAARASDAGRALDARVCQVSSPVSGEWSGPVSGKWPCVRWAALTGS